MVETPPVSPVLDAERLRTLVGYNVLDTLQERVFDEIAALAATICGAPIGLISFVDADRQWFKAHIGTELQQTPLRDSVCMYVLQQRDLLVIEDLTQDPRTADNGLVTGPPHARFYAGAAILAPNGQALGSLCVLDMQPRAHGLSLMEAETLRVLSRQVMNLLEMRRALRQTDELFSAQRRSQSLRARLLEVSELVRDSEDIPAMTHAVCALVANVTEADRAAFGRIGETGEYVEMEPGWLGPGMASVAGRHRFDDYGQLTADLRKGRPLIIRDVTMDPRTKADPAPLQRLDIGAFVSMPVFERGRIVAVLTVHSRAPRDWSDDELYFLRRTADRIEAAAGRLKAEARQRVLNHELSHRIKNSLSMVQAIATQTLRQSTEPEALRSFLHRVHALGTAHDILLQRQGAGARLGAIIREVLQRFCKLGRMDIGGPDNIMLGSQSTTNLSLIMHELATNAVKYGGLSTDTGMVRVQWDVEEPHQLCLKWQEEGGPAVIAPSRRGFGTRLISMGLLGRGGATLTYAPAGFAAQFRAPLDQLRTD